MAGALGRYELITQIGRGGMAEVHLALQRGLGGFEKLVVVKVLHPELAKDPDVIQSLRDEAKLVALVKHPNVVDVYEIGEADGRHFLAMEYLEGEPLLAVMEAGHVGPRLDPLSLARIVADTAEALDAAHRLKGRDGKPIELVHDDISLGNIVVLYTGQVKLVDFGVAKAKATAETTDKLHGKPGYMAPEKLDGKSADRRTDIWSLGVVLWEALAQRRLFKGADPAEVIREVRYVKITPPSHANPSVPLELDAIAMKALDREPSRRYQTAKDFAAAIEDALKARGYAARNDRIGAYMQKTFGERIAIREKLVAEVTSPAHTRPDDAMVHAAFGPTSVLAPIDPDGAADTSVPTTANLGASEPIAAISAVIASVEAPDTQVLTPKARPASEPAPWNPFDEGEQSRTQHDNIPADPAASRATRPRPDPSWAATPQARSIGQLQTWVQNQREEGGRKRHIVPYVVGSLVVIAILVGIVMATRNDGPSTASAQKPDAEQVVLMATLDAPLVPEAVPDSGPVVLAPPDAAIAPDAELLPDAPEPAVVVVMPPDAGVVAHIAPVIPKPHPVKPTASAQQLYTEGMIYLRKGENKKALASLTESRRANEKYAPVWYGLGVVNENLGNKGSAKSSYQRYLKLAPHAANAQLVRERMNRL